MLRLIQGNISLNNLSVMWDDLEGILESVDCDFIGYNGEEFFTSEGISQFESAINESETIEGESEKLYYVIEKCKEYSKNYYEGFEYTLINKDGDNFELVIALIEY